VRSTSCTDWNPSTILRRSAAGIAAEQFVAACCPYCGERFEARIEVSAGAQEYIEDCQVCCRPMALSIEVEDNGALHALRVQRMD